MNISPLRSLVTHHVCTCRTTAIHTAPARLLSSTASRNALYNTVPAGWGASEELRRRYKPDAAFFDKAKAERAQSVRRMRNASLGLLATTLALTGSIYFYKDELISRNQVRHDAAPPPPSSVTPDPTTIADANEQIPTGTSTIPFFPRTIHLSSTNTSTQSPSSPTPSGGTPGLPPTLISGETEYHLLGLGIRTVSILSIQVYVVGLYIAAPDIATLQQHLIRQIEPAATTLVPNEKAKLHDLLMDPVKGEEIFNTLLSNGKLRTAIRIVPTRNTDWMHMRDGFVRGITARSAHFANDLSSPEFIDESFGTSLNEFKSIFSASRKKIPWGETLYLTRDAGGALSAVHEDKSGTRTVMGSVGDERVGRLLWLGYLAGKSVSSEDARKKIVDGAVEVCGRPVGTVAEQVV